MNQFDIRLLDKNDPNTPLEIVTQIDRDTTDATDKFETFIVTHEPINLKAKLALRQRTPVPSASLPVEEEIIDEDYTDDDEDGVDL